MELATGMFQQVRLYVDVKYTDDEKTNLPIKFLFVILFFPLWKKQENQHSRWSREFTAIICIGFC